MGEVGHTQLGEDGRLHTMLADPHELPQGAVAAPAGPQIPSAPRASGRKKGSSLPLILGGLVVAAAIAVPVTIWATGGFDDEKEKKPKKTAPAAPQPPQQPAAPAPAPTPTPQPQPQPRPQQPPPQQKPQQPPPQQQPQSQPSGSSSGKKEPPRIPSGLPSNNPLATPWSR